MADRNYVSQSPTGVTSRELLPVAVSFANRLGEGESVSVADAAADVLLQELPDKADKTAALSGVAASSPNVNVTIDFRHASIATSKSYLLRVRGTIGSRKEEALWVFNTGWE